MGKPTAASSLSPRELEIALAYTNGASYRDIAERLFIAPSTVRTHLQTIYRKLDVSSKLGLRSILEKNGFRSSEATRPLHSDRPSIAVLPFSNMTGDPEQGYFADGISNDIIAELSRFRELHVIARNSSFSFKHNVADAQKAGAELGVGYVLEGSVRLEQHRVGITSQMIDAETGFHIWSERFNRQSADLFAVHDEIVQIVAATVSGRLKLAVSDRLSRKSPANMKAYDHVLRGEGILATSKSDNLRARKAFEKAIELDPTCSRGFVGLALSYVIEEFNAWDKPGVSPIERALQYAEKAISLDNGDGKAHAVLGHIYGELQAFEDSKIHLERALSLNPNDSDTYAYLGVYEERVGNPGGSVALYLKAMRLNPFYPAWYLWKLGTAHYFMAKYEDARKSLREAVTRNSKLQRARMALAATYAQIDQAVEARKHISQLLRYDPAASVQREHRIMEEFPSFMKNAWLAGLRKAGLPE